MNDERGPVQEKEVISRMVKTAAVKQGMPERSDVQDAIRGGHITEEEGKELRNLDQFSKYRPQTAYGTVPQAKTMDDMKFSTVYEPVTAPKPRAGHKTPYVEDTGAAAAPTSPKRTRAKKAAAPQPVSSQMRSYYGVYQDIDAESLPTTRGRRGGAKEGAGREFGNWQNTPDRIIQHSLQAGDLVNHQTHGVGKVVRIVNPGEFIPGTEERSKAGRAKKNTGQKYTEHHAEIDFGPKGVHRLPLNENISENQRQAVAAATPSNVPGFGGDIKTRGRLGLKAGKKGITARPMLEKIESPDK